MNSTPNVYPDDTAFHYLTEDETLLSRQSLEERSRLQDIRRARGRVEDANFLSDQVFRLPVESHPMVGFGERVEPSLAINATDERFLVLHCPHQRGGRDPALAKRLYRWERFDVFGILTSRNREAWLAESLQMMPGADPL